MAESHWQDAIIRNLEIIGEATKRLSDTVKPNVTIILPVYNDFKA